MEQRINPWAAQRELMIMSGQPVTTPTLHVQLTVLAISYAAMVLEEAGEFLLGFAKLMDATLTDSDDVETLDAIDVVGARFAVIATQMIAEAKRTRQHLADHKGVLSAVSFEPPQTEQHRYLMVEVADGLTDLHVVTAGTEISLGIDGGAAYREVWRSNDSKKVPSSDPPRIALDESGKWIKGAGYTPPNLYAVLFK
jgi:predicted HAD superfamily Cof-like phosphohydrolase